MSSRKKTAESVRAYQNNAIKKDPTGEHTTIKALLYKEYKKTRDWEYIGKRLITNVSAYVKRRHPYIYNTNFLELGEEKSARKTIREYLNQYALEDEMDDDLLIEDATNIEGMTIEEQDEELGALIEIDERELDYISLLKVKVDNPKIVDFISKDFDDIIESLNKLGRKLSIEEHMCSHVTELRRLKFAFKFAVPAVGSRKVHFVEDDDLFDQIDDISRDLMDVYVEIVPLSFTFPGMVDGKAYIIATVNLPKGTLVYNLPTEFKGFPVLIDYGTMRASTASECRKYQNLKPGISISDAKFGGVCTLGAFFKATEKPDKKYFLTVNHGIGEVGESIIQPGEMDNGNLAEHYCAKATKYKDLSIDASGRLLDFVFCEVDKHHEVLATNKPCQSNIRIKDIQCTLDHQVGSKILVQKVGRTTGHTF